MTCTEVQPQPSTTRYCTECREPGVKQSTHRANNDNFRFIVRFLFEAKTAYHFAPKPGPAAASHPIQLGAVKIPEGVTMANLGNALHELREERSGTQLRLEKLDQAISAIESLNSAGSSRKVVQPTRIVSAAARRKMALAQKARWAKTKGHAPMPKRTISAAGRKRIAAAQRARWAKLKAGKKAA